MKTTLLLASILAASLSASHATVTLTNLLGYYDFEGNTNNVVVAPNATLTPGASLSATALGYDGVGQALVSTTDTAGALVAAGLHFNTALTADKMAVSFWSYDTVSGDGSSSFRAVTSLGDGRGFQAHAPWSNDQIYFDHNGSASGGGVRLQVNPGATPINQWVHWVFQKDGGAKQIWRNGIQVGNQTSGANALAGLTGELHIGNDTVQNLQGRIDEFAVFDDVLSAAQIADLNSGTSVAALVGIPEPSAGVLVLFAAALGLRRRRR